MPGWFSDSWLEELRSRTNLEEVVSEYVSLKPKGRRYWGCCPFHNEKTPSFSVDTETQLYYCFGCHKGGTVFTFVGEMERLDFVDAVKLLAERAHMDLPTQSSAPRAHRDNADRERIYAANVAAAHWFHGNLWKPEGAQQLAYLYSRGMSDRDIKRFGLGASVDGWDALGEELKGQGFSEEELVLAGLLVNRGGRVHDMFRARVMFPIINAQGRVLGFGGRAMGDAQPKYLNTADTPVFNKRQGLYSLNLAKAERDAGQLVLVEGYMDVCSLRKYGVRGVVATLGTALTEEQARLMKRYAPQVIVSYDGDAAGQKAALRALDILESQGVPARVVDYPAGMDPDDFVKQTGLAGFDGLKKFAPAEYRMLRAEDGLDLTTGDGMTEYVIRCCGILKGVKSPVEQENYLRRLVQWSGYDRDVLLQQIGVSPGQQPGARAARTRIRREGDAVSPSESALATLLVRGTLPAGMVQPEDFSDPTLRDAAKWVIDGGTIRAFLDDTEEGPDKDRLLRAVNFSPLPEEPEEMVHLAETCVREIHAALLRERARQIEDEIKSGVPDDTKIGLYEKLNEIYDQLQD